MAWAVPPKTGEENGHLFRYKDRCLMSATKKTGDASISGSHCRHLMTKGQVWSPNMPGGYVSPPESRCNLGDQGKENNLSKEIVTDRCEAFNTRQKST